MNELQNENCEYTKQFARDISTKNQTNRTETMKKENKSQKWFENQPERFVVCNAIRALHGTLSWLMGELNKQQLNIFLFGHRLLHFVSSLFQMSLAFLLFFRSRFRFTSVSLTHSHSSLISHRSSNCRWFPWSESIWCSKFLLHIYNWRK